VKQERKGATGAASSRLLKEGLRRGWRLGITQRRRRPPIHPQQPQGIGFATDDVKPDRLPGWEPHSYGYHGDDGCAFHGSGQGREYGPKYGQVWTAGWGRRRCEQGLSSSCVMAALRLLNSRLSRFSCCSSRCLPAGAAAQLTAAPAAPPPPRPPTPG
jgi:hypothetical protein